MNKWLWMGGVLLAAVCLFYLIFNGYDCRIVIEKLGINVELHRVVETPVP